MSKLKRIISIALATFTLFLFGCSENAGQDKTSEGGDEMPYQYDLSDYVKLGQYKGIEYEKIAVTVTDEDVAAKRDSILSDNATLTETEEPAKTGDTVNIEYVGKIDGAEFENGSTTGPVDIVLGSSGYISGFDDGIVGMKSGETKDINCTFPDPYSRNSALSGKEAVFTVTVNTVKTAVLPEYNDQFVRAVSDGKYDTTAEYDEYLRKLTESEKKSDAETKQLQQIWTKVFENATIYSCPQVEIDRYTKQYTEYYESDADSYGVSFEDYLSGMYSLTTEQFDEQLSSYVQRVVEEELVLNAIIKEEKIGLSDDEYNDWIERYVETSDDVDSADDMKSKYSESEIRQRALADKVFEFLYDNAVAADRTTESISDTTAASSDSDAAPDTTTAEAVQ